ncbi:hypothetical protein FRAAL6487 [Frankia alni ACN14a]|uniref:Uncharacterized protein n=1 Tax=Frankia alni (strain DSM 45986 / CECT 9034 / ACN14a) TaxID=326424 RepID=Q0RBS4_FRAAA|nr:hypothetical protein FRAAL6487 [Frankia alni ACN14a]
MNSSTSRWKRTPFSTLGALRSDTSRTGRVAWRADTAGWLDQLRASTRGPTDAAAVAVSRAVGAGVAAVPPEAAGEVTLAEPVGAGEVDGEAAPSPPLPEPEPEQATSTAASTVASRPARAGLRRPPGPAQPPPPCSRGAPADLASALTMLPIRNAPLSRTDGTKPARPSYPTRPDQEPDHRAITRARPADVAARGGDPRGWCGRADPAHTGCPARAVSVAVAVRGRPRRGLRRGAVNEGEVHQLVEP